MPVLLLDLDNTLIDRDVAFRRSVAAFLDENDLPGEDLEWVLAEDAEGYAPRDRVAAAMRTRWGDAVGAEQVQRLLARGAMDDVRPDAAIDAALRTATAAGWVPVVITNGGSVQQRGKLANARLDRLVAAAVISEEVGCRKPEPEIFRTAANAVRATLDGAWMIGDSLTHDIAGASLAGIDSIWLSRGRPRPDEAADPRPSRIAEWLPEAVELLPRPEPGPPVRSHR